MGLDPSAAPFVITTSAAAAAAAARVASLANAAAAGGAGGNINHHHANGNIMPVRTAVQQPHASGYAHPFYHHQRHHHHHHAVHPAPHHAVIGPLAHHHHHHNAHHNHHHHQPRTPTVVMGSFPCGLPPLRSSPVTATSAASRAGCFAPDAPVAAVHGPADLECPVVLSDVVAAAGSQPRGSSIAAAVGTAEPGHSTAVVGAVVSAGGALLVRNAHGVFLLQAEAGSTCPAAAGMVGGVAAAVNSTGNGGHRGAADGAANTSDGAWHGVSGPAHAARGATGDAASSHYAPLPAAMTNVMAVGVAAAPSRRGIKPPLPAGMGFACNRAAPTRSGSGTPLGVSPTTTGEHQQQHHHAAHFGPSLCSASGFAAPLPLGPSPVAFAPVGFAGHVVSAFPVVHASPSPARTVPIGPGSQHGSPAVGGHHHQSHFSVPFIRHSHPSAAGTPTARGASLSAPASHTAGAPLPPPPPPYNGDAAAAAVENSGMGQQQTSTATTSGGRVTSMALSADSSSHGSSSADAGDVAVGVEVAGTRRQRTSASVDGVDGSEPQPTPVPVTGGPPRGVWANPPHSRQHLQQEFSAHVPPPPAYGAKHLQQRHASHPPHAAATTPGACSFTPAVPSSPIDGLADGTTHQGTTPPHAALRLPSAGRGTSVGSGGSSNLSARGAGGGGAHQHPQQPPLVLNANESIVAGPPARPSYAAVAAMAVHGAAAYQHPAFPPLAPPHA